MFLPESNMDQEQINSHVISAIAKMFENDEVLLRINVSERAITHRLAMYLADEFPEWDVDCEYNRNGHDRKKLVSDLNDLKEPEEEPEESSVYPDIIIHHRTQSYYGNNLLVIEIKKSTNSQNRFLDQRKLEIFTTGYDREEMNYHYQHGILLEVRAWQDIPDHGQLKAEGTWYCNGESQSEEPVQLYAKNFDYRS